MIKKDLIVKVCGLADNENIIEIDNLNIDFIGMIFYSKSPRFIVDKVTDMKMLNETLSKVSAKKTGVFVNESLENILKYASDFSLDYIQLHGNESIDICDGLKSMGYGVIKALNIGESSDFVKCEKYEPYVDFFIFDTPCKGYGGSGEKFDWQLLREYNYSKDFLLSGGISFDDSEEILNIDIERFIGVDLNSRFELKPALKDIEMFRSFIEKLRNN